MREVENRPLFVAAQELQAKLRAVVFDRRTWELRRAKDQAHLHQYYVQDHEVAPVHDDSRAHVRGRRPLGHKRSGKPMACVLREAV